MVELNLSQDNSEHKIMSEIWNTDQIDTRTEVNPLQIESINKLSTMAVIFNNKILHNHLTQFMRLQKSKERKSMKEFVDIVRAKREDFVEKGKGFFGSMMG